MNKRILILGASGMLGSSIFRYLSKHTDYEVVGFIRSDSVYAKLLNQGFKNIVTGNDIETDEGFRALHCLIKEIRPNYVINCIGIIKQLDKAKNKEKSIYTNSLFPHKLASICDDIHSKLIHFSTDCVFSGRKGMYKENDLPDAVDLYGRSKLLGEVNYGNHLTFRTSIIGHEIIRNLSLINWFITQTGTIKGFSKAFFSGLPTVYIAEFISNVISTESLIYGIYHLSAPPIDKYNLLCLVKERYNIPVHIEKDSNFEINRSLDSNKLQRDILFEVPNWPELITKMHDEYQEYFI